jgi:hypothetical protein
MPKVPKRVFEIAQLLRDPRLNWLDSNPHFRRLREFPSLVLYHYHPSS